MGCSSLDRRHYCRYLGYYHIPVPIILTSSQKSHSLASSEAANSYVFIFAKQKTSSFQSLVSLTKHRNS
jgi:hypothetical protein